LVLSSLTLSAASLPPIEKWPGLVSWWSAEGNAEDNCDRHHGKLEGAVTFGPGKFGQAFYFTGNVSGVNLGDWFYSDNFSIALWVKPESRQTEYAAILDSNHRINQNWVLQQDQDRTNHYYWAPGDESALCHFHLEADVWQHLVITRDSNQVNRVYLDGRLIAKEQAPHLIGHVAPAVFRIGKCGEFGRYWKGSMDEIAVFDRPLSLAEIHALFDPASLLPKGWNRVKTLVSSVVKLHGFIFFAAPSALSLLVLGLVLAAGRWRSSGRAIGRPSLSVRALRPAWVVLTFGFVLSGLISWAIARVARQHDQARFTNQALVLLEQIETRIELYTEALNGLRSQFGFGDIMTPARWANYVKGMNLPVHYRGLCEVGAVERVLPDEIQTHEAFHRVRLGPEYRIHALNKDHDVGWSAPIVWHAYGSQREQKSPPFTRYGWDLNRDSNHALAMSAFALNFPGATGRINVETPMRDSSLVKGFRIFVPWFDPNMPAPHLTHLRGLVFGTVDIRAFLESTLGDQKPELGFVIYDSAGKRTENLLFGDKQSLEMAGPSSRSYFTGQFELPLYRRRLYFDFYTLPQFEARSLLYWPWIALGVGTLLSVLVSAITFVQSKARHEQDRAIQERKRLSRDLHDSVIQSIYAVGLGLQSCRRLVGKDPEKASERMTENMAELNGVVEQLRRFILSLGPELMQGPAFSEALQALVRTMERAETAQLSLEIEPGTSEQLTPDQAVHALNITREAISNSLRHAEAEQVVVSLRRHNGAVRIEIRDNGHGFDTATPARTGQGLRNMAARVEEMRGKLQIVSKPGGSETTVQVDIPVKS
jgi:signal transduction histidine kinase